MDRVRITDVSPRDGLQNEPGTIPTADKVELIRRLCLTGVDEIEVTSFVSPKWVPQLADAQELCLLLPPLPEGGGGGWAPSAQQPTNRRWRPPARQSITLDRAYSLRKAATEPEKALWACLRDREWMGAKFRRQHPFGPYILDFFCQEKLLAVEIDGVTHRDDDARRHDARRDEWVASFGVLTLRFAQNDVIADPGAVASRVRDVLRRRESAGSRKPTPLPLPLGGGEKRHPVFSALVPNEKGLDAALDVGARHHVLSKVSVFTAASESFSKKNTNATIAETLDRFTPVLERSHDESFLVRGYISCVIACPFEGTIAPAAVARVARQLVDLGADEIDLGDTIGAGTPETIRAMLAAVRAELGDSWLPADRLTLHLHDTFGRAADCVKAALDFGVRSFDGSVAGLGGCPYASTPGKRAPGNISTELLVQTIHDAGYATGVDKTCLAEAADFARAIIAKSRAAAHPC